MRLPFVMMYANILLLRTSCKAPAERTRVRHPAGGGGTQAKTATRLGP